MRTRIAASILSFLILGFVFAQRAHANPGATVTEAQNTMKTFEKTDPSLQRFVQSSAGYVVFPSIGKGAVGVGGAHGTGVLFEHGKPIGEVDMTQVTVGLALGGQNYAQIIFFENQAVLDGFKEGNFALAASASAVALSAGAASTAEYEKGLAIFTATKSGLMFEASVGGQKFHFTPYKEHARRAHKG
jgi:lipid-binding SYLF domain-containing protein